MVNLEFYVASEWEGWLCGFQIVSVFSAAQDKFGKDDKDVKKFGTKHIINDIPGSVEDLRKLKLSDEEIVNVLDDAKNKMMAKIMRAN